MSSSHANSDQPKRPSFFRKYLSRHRESSESVGDQHSNVPSASDCSKSSVVWKSASSDNHRDPIQDGNGSLNTISDTRDNATPSLQLSQHDLPGNVLDTVLSPKEQSHASVQYKGNLQPFNQNDQPAVALTSTINKVRLGNEAKLSLWDRAYEALREADQDDENWGLVGKYESLVQRELLSGSQQNELDENERNPQNLPDVSIFESKYDQRSIDKELTKGKTKGKMQGKIIVRGRIIDVEKYLKKVAEGTEFLNNWVSQAVKASPEASLAWSIVCMAAPFLTKPAETRAANAEGLAYVSSRMHLYIAWEEMWSSPGHVRQSTAGHNHFSSSMVELYRLILEFQIRSVLCFDEPSWTKDLINKYDWRNKLIKIRDLEKMFKSDSKLIGNEDLLILVNEANEIEKRILASNERLLDNSSKQVDLADQHLQLERDARTEEEKIREDHYIQRLRLQIFYETFKDSNPPRVEGTCSWFLSQPSYTTWLEKEAGCLLVSADPGCGKSVLARHLIENELKAQNSDRMICYFFFKDKVQNTLAAALCALLHQLFIQRREMVRYIVPLAVSNGAKLPEDRDGLLKVLKQILLDSDMSKVTIVLDALDECNADDREKLMTWIADFATSHPTEHKFLLTTRPYQDIIDMFDQISCSLIQISGEDNSIEIRKEVDLVIKYRCEKLRDSKHISEKVHNRLLERLLLQESNTYLYVYLIFQELKKREYKQQSVKEFDKWYKILPKTVNQAYEAILDKVPDDTDIRQQVLQLLTVMVGASRPLTVQELQCAVKLDLSEPPKNHEDLDLVPSTVFRDRIRTWCGLLVQIQDNGTVIFLHQTVREFLMSNDRGRGQLATGKWIPPIGLLEAQVDLTKICILYLSLEDFAHTTYWDHVDKMAETQHVSGQSGSTMESDSEDNSSIKAPKWDILEIYEEEKASRYPFLTYATRNWEKHFITGQCDKDEQITALAVSLYTGNEQRLFIWAYEMRMVSRRWSGKRGTFPTMTGYMQCSKEEPLVVCAGMNSQTIFSHLLRVADIKSNPTLGEQSLRKAITYKREDSVLLLLKSGVNPNCEFGYGSTALIHSTPLSHSIDRSSITITKLLFESGANVDGKSFLRAVINEDPQFIQCLLEHLRDVESVIEFEIDTLFYSARGNKYEATEFLLNQGMDVNTQVFSGRTAILTAAQEGHLEIVRLLLGYNADPDIQNVEKDTALICAARRGHHDIVGVLLEYKKATTTIDKEYLDTALHSIAKGPGKNDFVPLDVLPQMVEKHKETLKILIEAGADISVPDEEGVTPLMHLVFRLEDNGTLVEHFIQRGADVHALDHAGRNCMHYVRNPTALEVLLSHEMSLDSLDACGKTPLLYLVLDHRWIKAVSAICTMYSLMLEHHADRKIKDCSGLHAPACLEGLFSVADGDFSPGSEEITLDEKANLASKWLEWDMRPRFRRLNLNTCLGNDNGQIVWKQDGNISASARNMELMYGGRVLKAEVLDNEGSWKLAYMWLDEKISSDNGRLKYIGSS